MRLYIEGHNHRLGYAIAGAWSDDEIRRLPWPADDELAPVRFIQSLTQAQRLVERFNRMQARRAQRDVGKCRIGSRGEQ